MSTKLPHDEAAGTVILGFNLMALLIVSVCLVGHFLHGWPMVHMVTAMTVLITVCVTCLPALLAGAIDAPTLVCGALLGPLVGALSWLTMTAALEIAGLA